MFGFVGRLTVTGYVSDGTLKYTTQQIDAKPIAADLPGAVARCSVVKLRTRETVLFVPESNYRVNDSLVW